MFPSARILKTALRCKEQGQCNNTSSPWMPPARAELKLNTDAAVQKDTNLFGAAVIHDSEGNVVSAFLKPLLVSFQLKEGNCLAS